VYHWPRPPSPTVSLKSLVTKVESNGDTSLHNPVKQWTKPDRIICLWHHTQWQPNIVALWGIIMFGGPWQQMV